MQHIRNLNKEGSCRFPFINTLRSLGVFAVVLLQASTNFGQTSIFFTGVENLHYYNSSGPVNIVEDTSYAVIHFGSAVTPSDLSTLIDSFPDSDLFEEGDGVTISSDESLETIFNNNDQFIADYDLESFDVQSIAPGYTVAGSPSYVNDEIVIRVENGIALNDLTPRISRFGGNVEDSITNEVLLIKLDSIEGQLELIQELYALNLIEWGQPNFHVEVCSAEIDPMFKNQYQLNNEGQKVGRIPIIPGLDIGALDAWRVTKGDSSIRVAVMDDGLEFHEDLTNIIPGFNPTTLSGGEPDIQDSYHGQACAGLIAADHNDIGIRGVAPDVSITGINISSCGVTVAEIAKGFLWARDNDIDIISNSWGFQQRDSIGRVIGPVCSQDLHPVITDAINETAANGRSGKGCVIVFSSGNSYSPNPENYCVTYPANIDAVISVGAINPSNSQRSAYSCFGPRLDISAPSSSLLDFWVNTLDRMDEFGSSLSNYKNDFGGTSAAAPLVAGVAALMLSIDNELHSDKVAQIIQHSSTDIGSAGFDPEFGHGMLNAYNALLETMPGSTEYLPNYDCLGNQLLIEQFESLQNDPRTQLISSPALTDGSNSSFWFNIIPDNQYESIAFEADGFSNLKLSFDFIVYNTSFGDSFELQLSTDNGLTYHTVNTFTYSHDYLNSTNYDYTTTLEGLFGANTILRFVAEVNRSESSIFLDNINVGTCSN